MTPTISARFSTWFCALMVLSSFVSAQVQSSDLSPTSVNATGDESLLVEALNDIRGGELDAALYNIEKVLEHKPNFRLAQLVYADILLAKSGAVPGLDIAAGKPLQLSGLRDEAQKRLNHDLFGPPEGALPKELLVLSPEQQRVVVVDVSASRMYVFENRRDELRLIDDFYASTGKRGALKVKEGDQRTPIGVYFITGRIGPDVLPDFYGPGALPVNYPNEWDVRLGRTGYGIWIHGVPSDTYARVPRASDGCVAIANDDLAPLLDTLPAGQTPVVMVDGVDWIGLEELHHRRAELLNRIAHWREAWESLDVSLYAGFYSAEFQSQDHDRASWVAHKSRVNAKKSFIEVELGNLSVLGYPGEQQMVLVSFEQNYQSSNFESQSKKRQFWRRERDGQWRIVYEGAARLLPEHVRGIPFSARSNITQLSP